jgi:hypothetical protein
MWTTQCLSFIPNTAEVSFYGMVKGMENHFNAMKFEKFRHFHQSNARSTAGNSQYTGLA